ncbi:amino acid permease [Frankia sp. AgB32]|uniref:amino acid permease n=1 Tax=Frankia sp. AgB32 TaxID=631119 RepID=UPI00200F150C|nr:amino acid permease [Frankia sp. AgB32]MCK9895398.1 amino acid permease [Frankia sp. AgB32]
MAFEQARRGGKRVDVPGERWLRSFGLFGLAAGGVIGSGWFLTPAGAYASAGSAGRVLLSWAVGGLAMLLIATVMVELGTAAPRTGGLIFLPYQSSGPFVTLVVATSLWIYYVVNLASEATAATVALAPDLSAWLGVGVLQCTDGRSLNWSGMGVAIAIMVAVSVAVALVPARRFINAMAWITVVKIAGIVFVGVALLVIFQRHGFDVSRHVAGTPARCDDAHPGRLGWLSTFLSGAGEPNEHGWFATLVGGSVVYAYLGFQGPLDYAGDIRTDGIGEKARIRRTVIGAVLLSVLIYLLLQVAYNWYVGAMTRDTGARPLDFLDIAGLTTAGYLRDVLEVTLRIVTVVAPLGAGLVYAYVLPSEIAELSKLPRPLTYRRLGTAVVRRRNGDNIYWLVLVVNVVVGAVLLLLAQGYWSGLSWTSGVLGLFLYAFPAVALMSLAHVLDRDEPNGTRPARRTAWWRFRRELLPRVSFAVASLMLFEAGFDILWRAVTLLGGGVVLVGAPMLRGRWRAARPLVNADGCAAWAAGGLAGYIGGLLLLAWWHRQGTDGVSLAVTVVVWSAICGQSMTRHSRAYNEVVPPLLS